MTEQTIAPARVEVTDAIRNRMKEIGSFDLASAAAFAAETGLTPAQVRAVAVRAGIYAAKPKVSKNGDAVETKEDIVGNIANLLGVDTDRVESLGNATKQALKLVRSALRS